jgi:hypothetical protein
MLFWKRFECYKNLSKSKLAVDEVRSDIEKRQMIEWDLHI